MFSLTCGFSSLYFMYVGITLHDPWITYIGLLTLLVTIKPNWLLRSVTYILILGVVVRDWAENPLFLAPLWSMYLVFCWKRAFGLVGVVEAVLGLYYHLKIFA